MTNEALPARLRELFYQLHRHPELGFEEFETTRLVREALTEAGIEVLDTGLPTGLVCRVGGGGGRCVGLRCDMDALPIQEETGLAYASCVPGKMHACGHDFHTAAMLGAALLLKEREQRLPGSAVIVFQPAEEITLGARAVVATGAVDAPDVFLGIHSYPGFPVGTLGIKPGPVMASVDRFRVVIQGVGSHAGTPQKGLDPVPVMAALIQAAQTIVSRALSPFADALLSITHAEAGNTWNVIPMTALLEGTVRTLDPRDRETILKHFTRMTHEISAAWGATAEITWDGALDAVINDEGLCEVGAQVARELGFEVGRQEDTMGGEDFSEYLQHPRKRPGLFVRVGTGVSWANHHPKFVADPDALYPASRYFAALAERLMRAD